MKPVRRILITALTLLPLTALPLIAHGQADFPNKPIRIVVPFPAGGTLDTLGRLLSPKLQETLGQPVVIDPRAGGATAIGTQAVQKAAPDGYTLLFMANSFVLVPMLMQKAPWDPIKDFVPVSLVARVNQVLVAHPSLEANTVKQLVALAKAAPGKLNFASFGNGTSSHLAVELFKTLAGIDMQHISYKGMAPAMQDILGGQVKVLMSNIPDAIPQLKAGKLKALGVADDKRSAQLPDVPTFAEQGFPGYAVYSWYAVVAPAGTPDPVVKKLHAAFSAAVKDPVVTERLVVQQGMTVLNAPGEDLRRFMEAEQKRYAEPVRISGAKIE
jgi:tripartite-type tricarboxylate transporter receptor subunit TctC